MTPPQLIVQCKANMLVEPAPIFALQVSRIEDTVSWRPGAIHDQVGVKQRVFEVLRNMRGLFSGSVRRPMLLMIYINFAIQFG